ncbi:MAG: 50S ribosomal protein L4 [Elusimicrobiota bacterium]
METKLFNLKGEEKGTVALPESIFSVKCDPYFLHELVRYYNASARVGTASTKTRTEVSGGGRKPWKQKHTGRARAGSNRSPLWRKGGVVFGPKPRDFSMDIPAYKRTLGLVQALSDKQAAGGIMIFENFDMGESKTSAFVLAMDKVKVNGKKTLIVTSEKNTKLILAAGNVKGFSVKTSNDLNAMDVMKNHFVLIEKGALEKLSKRLEVK